MKIGPKMKLQRQDFRHRLYHHRMRSIRADNILESN